MKRKPGWYEDPNGLGHERYWDGSRWTAQTRKEKSSWAKLAPGGGKPEEKPKKRPWRH